MGWSGPWFVIAIIGLTTFGCLVSNWIRAKHGYPIENDWGGMSERSDTAPADRRKIELLTAENDKLHGQVGRLEERIAVLERIATDPAARLDREIEKLR